MLYKYSKKLRVAGLLLVVSGACMLGLGGLSFIEYGLPMALGRYTQASQRLSIGSRGEALFNEAVDAYDQNHWDDAAKNALAAFSAVSNANGQVPDEQRLLAAQAQFIVAASLVEQSKHEPAVAAYDLALSLMPDDLSAREVEVVKAARRTREWLRQAAKKKGASQPKPDDKPTPTKARRKGRI